MHIYLCMGNDAIASKSSIHAGLRVGIGVALYKGSAKQLNRHGKGVRGMIPVCEYTRVRYEWVCPQCNKCNERNSYYRLITLKCFNCGERICRDCEESKIWTYNFFETPILHEKDVKIGGTD